ncbi:MAG: sigma-54 dependent transcriptional regulator [Alphaproteobacteria bacterium]|nr:sigma-54 dependent transcriptional regulator [Alphaproteobacteria bacterium]
MNVLVIGTSREEVACACAMAAAKGNELRHVETIDGAMALLQSAASPDLLLVDVEIDIDALVRRLGEEHFFVPVIAYGVDTDPRTAVRAVKSGALEFLPLPPDESLIAAVFSSMTGGQHAFVFEDQAMMDVLSIAKRVAPSDASLLITGESGTGKEIVARYVHQHSRRHDKRLVSVNCAAIPDNLLESELFGHEKGAFTGANARRIGKFEEANGGTLLLDEISEMDPRLQAKLLRAIQEREIDRVGGTKPIKVDIRLLATSNRDLPAEVRAGRFREDLLFRLNVVQLELPPLRDRPGDLAPLAHLFIERYAQANGMPARTLDSGAIALLRQHRWPGNVRELENCIHRAVLLSRGEAIGPDAIILPDNVDAFQATRHDGGDEASSFVGRSVAEVERRLIVDTLEHTLGNRTRAATILGISIRTLRNKLKQYSDEGMTIPPAGADAARFVADRP